MPENEEEDEGYYLDLKKSDSELDKLIVHALRTEEEEEEEAGGAMSPGPAAPTAVPKSPGPIVGPVGAPGTSGVPGGPTTSAGTGTAPSAPFGKCCARLTREMSDKTNVYEWHDHKQNPIIVLAATLIKISNCPWCGTKIPAKS